MITSNNIFKASEVDPDHPQAWIVDTSGPDAVNPDCYWYFRSQKQAQQFADLINGGMRGEEAQYHVWNESAAVTLGSMTSDRKAASSRENGRKGGRPKKS